MSLRRARVAAALWGGFLFALTSWPNPPSPEAGGFPLDKLTHFTLYAVEAFLLYRAVRWEGRGGFAWTRVLTIVGILALWGALDEAHQEWIPGRRMDSDDLAADVAGAVTGGVLAGVTAGRIPGRRSRTDGAG
jgi:VanZ family protein